MNPFEQLLKENNVKAYQVASKIGMPYSTVYRVVRDTGIPDGTMIKTIKEIASYFGYRVEIRLIKLDDIRQSAVEAGRG